MKILTTKIKASYLMICLYLFNHLARALSNVALPTEITSNTHYFESGLAWALKIGGMGSIVYGAVSFARNKLQGQAADQVVLIMLGLGGGSFLLGWWIGQAKTASSGFAFW
ncbi:MAG: hypothetical protein K0R14_230 [Burkholderiales bacterium]|nr:hypothetical protein [Burkholderiales bacterium]